MSTQQKNGERFTEPPYPGFTFGTLSAEQTAQAIRNGELVLISTGKKTFTAHYQDKTK